MRETARARLFIVLQQGQIVIHDGAQLLPPPFLDISNEVSCCVEQGLLSVAFHPGYASNGLFFVFYTDTNGDSVVARYSVSSNPDVADPGSEVVLLMVSQPFVNHNGGQLQFGPDDFLYVGLGDGGGGGDPQNNAQNLSVLLGKILRIDVDGGCPTQFHRTTLFVGVASARPEIWSYGLRNPWRFSFDRLNGDLFIGDVGQDNLDEVNYAPTGSSGGENYGWRLMEGSQCFEPASNCNDGTLTLPIAEYAHSLGCSVTGAYRYRGQALSGRGGTYFFADFCEGRFWGAVQDGQGSWTTTEELKTGFRVSTFGEDELGELYFAEYGLGTGAVYRLIAPVNCEITLNQTTYTVGDDVNVTAFSIQKDAATDFAVEFKSWLVLADLPPISLFNIGAGREFVLPAGFAHDFDPLTLFQVDATAPSGRYELSCRVLDPVTGELISEDLNVFTIP